MKENNSDRDCLFTEDQQEAPERNFEFIDLKLYADTEILHKNERKYRTLFQGPDADLIYGEISFHNLMYRKSDWDINIEYILTTFESHKTVDEIRFTFEVSKNESRRRIVKAFGSSDKGGFWKKGMYRWTVQINGEYITEKIFCIEDNGYAGKRGIPYMDLEAVKLFKGGKPDSSGKCEKYYKGFVKKTKQAVDIEITARNLLKNIPAWYGEFIFQTKTELGELKAELPWKFIARDTQTEINFRAIHPDYLSFSDGIYFVEVIFNEKLIARIPFKIGDEEIPSTPEEHKNLFPDIKEYFRTAKNDDEIMQKLNELTGLEEVKKTVQDQLTYFKFQNLRKRRRCADELKINLNSLFIGNPGTGKTIVAKMLGKIYKDAGLLSSGHIYEVGRPELVAEYIGHTALKVKEAIAKARGGILFIDEAYSLAREKDNKRDFGAEVIEVLIKEMSDGQGDIAIIAAGYSDEMKILLDSNPGLKSRFKHTFFFKDYTPDELLEIAVNYCHKKKLSIVKPTRENLYKIIVKEWRKRDKSFGNARFVEELVDRAEMRLSQRMMRYRNADKYLKTFTPILNPSDFENEKLYDEDSFINLPIDEEGLNEAMNELNSLTGMKNVKDDITKLTKLIRYKKEEGENYLSSLSLHSVFTGNPGTGKTTVARIMAKIFSSLGILERGHLVECSREDLVSGYSGQTSIKTAKIIEKAIGGVLFIDEAYSLTNGGEQDYGKEVIETLLKKMEDRRGEFAVICAGYTEQMNNFLDSNPGLRSRFDRIIDFTDYSYEELYDIALDLLKAKNLYPRDIFVDLDLMSKVARLDENGGRNFANAREVRRFVEQIVINQNLRVSEIPKNKRTNNERCEILREDFIDISIGEDKKRARLGFT